MAKKKTAKKKTTKPSEQQVARSEKAAKQLRLRELEILAADLGDCDRTVADTLDRMYRVYKPGVGHLSSALTQISNARQNIRMALLAEKHAK